MDILKVAIESSARLRHAETERALSDVDVDREKFRSIKERMKSVAINAVRDTKFADNFNFKFCIFDIIIIIIIRNYLFLINYKFKQFVFYKFK